MALQQIPQSILVTHPTQIPLKPHARVADTERGGRQRERMKSKVCMCLCVEGLGGIINCMCI